MDDDQREQISQALHDGLYAILGTGEVSKEEAKDSLRSAIYLVNDEWGIDTGSRSEEDPEALDEESHHPDEYPGEYHDELTGARTRITDTHLVVFTGPSSPAEYHGTSVEYPLEKIGWVKAMALPGGQTAIALGVDGEPQSPGLTFKDPGIAEDLEMALLAARQKAARSPYPGVPQGIPAEAIREQIVSNACTRDWLYVSLVVTDWKHYEEKQTYLRADGAVEVLYDLANEQGITDAVSGATEEGRQRLGEYMRDRKINGPARLAEVEAEIDRLESEPATRQTTGLAPGYYSDLQRERASIRDDLEIADDTLRYLDDENIEHC